jgi:MFS family permease
VLAGPYLVPIVLVAAAAVLSFVFLRPDPHDLADEQAAALAAASAPQRLAEIVRRPSVALAILALVAGQFVMVLIMTMTPLHMTDHGHHLDNVGFVISGHVFGMFGLAPISGRLTDRFGSVRVIYAGTVVIAVSGLLSGIAPPTETALLFVALFLLGWGWNLGFVAGSAMLTGGVSVSERTKLQGVADALIWSTAAIASLGSGVLLESFGYASLGILGAVLVGLVAGTFLLGRRSLDRPPQASPLIPEID